MQSYYNIIDYIPYVLHCIPVTCLFYNWSMYLFIPTCFASPTITPSSNLLVCCLPESVSVSFYSFL